MFGRRRFNPRAPERARHTPATSLSKAARFQSTRPRKSATVRIPKFFSVQFVSIHAPPKERDCNSVPVTSRVNVSIHAPPKERDSSQRQYRQRRKFQSTRPRKSATIKTRYVNPFLRFQSTRPRKSATASGAICGYIDGVSIHAPPKERDKGRMCGDRCSWFQSTRPRKSATRDLGSSANRIGGFNPRAPERARHRCDGAFCKTAVFQSTRPRKSATQCPTALLPI